jgi:hypothetical protein
METPRDRAVAVTARLMLSAAEELLEPFHRAGLATGPFASVVDALSSNLHAAVTVGSLPYNLVTQAIQDLHLQRLQMAARIRALMDVDAGAGLSPEQERRADKKAREELSEKLSSQDFQADLVNEVLATLNHTLAHPEFSQTADELLRQVAVMTWSAFEVFSNDLGTKLINMRPTLATKLSDIGSYRKSGVIRGVPIDTLEEFGFDISGVMGDILFSAKRMDSLESIKEFYGAIVNNQKLDKALKSSSLWLLAQRRHLIVHRRGIVDNRYIQSTPETQPLGSRIKIATKEIDDNIKEVRDVAILMAECVAIFL